MFLKPNDDRIQNHCEQKHQREQQDYRLQCTHNQPDDEYEKNHPNDASGTVITQRSVRILAMGVVHRCSAIFAFTNTNDKKE
jgi:hypothetical protein